MSVHGFQHFVGYSDVRGTHTFFRSFSFSITWDASRDLKRIELAYYCFSSILKLYHNVKL